MQARRRAPQRSGHRTTLRVPDALMEAAEVLARDLGTTPNDALVRLAQDGMAAAERRQAVERLAAARRAAVADLGELGQATGFPSPEALRAAMLSGRHAP